jgi:hypothetical protein
VTGLHSRDGEIEAFVVDRYLESLLARDPDPGADVPHEMRATAVRLVRSLPRFHPSFRFEEELAARLAFAARSDTASGETLIALPEVTRTPLPAPAGAERVGPTPVRPVLVGGVLTSAAISIAGAAYVAWRRSRQPDGAMLRAVRAVARARTV